MKSPRIPLLLLGSLLTHVWSQSVEIDSSFKPPLPAGTVHSIALGSDGAVFVGGEFGGPSVLKVSATDAAPAISVHGGAYGLVAAGELCAGGSFGLATATWNVPANGRVLAVATAGDRFLIGGTFWSQPGCFVARLNDDGSVDSTFASGLKMNFSMEAGVSALAVQADGKAIVGGNFDTDAGFTSLARLNGDGSVDRSFSHDNGPVLYPKVIKILADGKILLGGVADSSGRGFVRRLNADGTIDTSFAETSLNGSVEALAVDQGGRIIVGGAFTAVNGNAQERLTRLNSDGTLDAKWTIGANNVVKAVAVQGGAILVGGAFTDIGGVSQNSLARLHELSAFGARPELHLSLDASAGQTYVIESSSDLKNWSEVRRESGTDQGLAVSTSTTAPRLFFRARVAE